MEQHHHHTASEPAQRRRRRPPPSKRPTDSTPTTPTSTTAPTAPTPTPSRPSRRSRFKATLTDQPGSQSSSDASTTAPRKPRNRRRSPPGDDLTSTLTHALRTPPFPDCPICFNAIRPEHQTWSCSPPVNPENTEAEDKSCCWTTLHLKCVRAWAEKSVKELEEAWRARGEPRPGEWRCPGCRTTRQAVPSTYMCFCLRMRHPAPPRIATPHSCAQPCSRPRSNCTHACPLPCHPGPCPPCAVTIRVACFCGKEKHSAKCQVGLTASSFSCNQPCRKPLTCGNSEHLCPETCHEGPCPTCPARDQVQCWCGRETKDVGCGEAKVDQATKCTIVEDDGTERSWSGSYGCGLLCNRSFACSQHTCSKPCHPPSRTPPPCPFDPERVLSCACGRCRVARSSDEQTTSSSRSATTILPPRSSCASPLPTCSSPCSKPLPCGHLCQATCHWDPCPPCSKQVERTCRCGATKHKSPCSESVIVQQYTETDHVPASAVILCDKPCQASLTCGRHTCGRICCPLAGVHRSTKASKQPSTLPLELDPTLIALHECDLICDRVLSCGNHRCMRLDHKGPCAPCPRGVFEELVCPCGRMVLEPPISCGTRLRCTYPCARPAPTCGHPHVEHLCHAAVVVAGADTADEGLGVAADMNSDRACPPCPFLTDKVCACGKKRVNNVRCSQERVSCGIACGKLLACGFHHCDRSCHADACGTCTAVCGKSRKSCLPEHHPCTETCHAPAACPETEPCLAPVTLTCPCGHLRSTVPCSGTKRVLACTGECEIKKRNARLADALGISEEKREARGKVTWTGELVVSARAYGSKFLGIVEKAFADFITSDRRTQVLPHMPLDRRKFVHALASMYRMDTVMVDQEPHRSVQLIRRIDTRIPEPLLSQHVASTMGKLVDLRLAGGKGTTASGATASAWGAGASGPGAVSGRVGTGTSWRSGGSGAAALGGWNAVVAQTALGAPTSGSSTPARVPSPAGGEVVREREGSPGPSRLAGGAAVGGGAKGVWVSTTVQTQRAKDSVPTVVVKMEGAEETVQDEVPDNWEDEA